MQMWFWVILAIGVICTAIPTYKSYVNNKKNKKEAARKSVPITICGVVATIALAIVANFLSDLIKSKDEHIINSNSSSIESNSNNAVSNNTNVSIDGVSSSVSDYSSQDKDINKDGKKSDSDDSDSYMSINDEIDTPEPSTVPLKNVFWFKKIMFIAICLQQQQQHRTKTGLIA